MYPSSYQPAPGENIRYFNRGNTWDGHGGNAEEHRKEMRKIAEEAIKDLVPQMAAEIFDRAIETAIGAIEHDVNTIVTMSFNDAHDIFTSKKAQKYVSDKIMREIKKELRKTTLNVKMK